MAVAATGTASEETETALNTKALAAFQQLARQLQQPGWAFDSLAFYVHFKLGELQHYFDRTEEALHHYRQSIAFKQRAAVLPDSLVFRPCLFSGIIYYNRNQFDSAFHFLQQAEAVKGRYNVTLSDEERLYNNLGALHYATGNFRQAKNYFQKAADVLPAHHPYYRDLLVNYYINLASALTTLEEYEAAHAIYQKILAYGSTTDVILHNIGVINLNLGAAPKALHFFRQVRYNSSRLVPLYNDMAVAFHNLQQQDSAEHYFALALAENQRWNGTRPNVAHGLTLKGLGDLHQSSNPEAALQHYQAALHQFYPAFNSKELSSNPDTFSGLFSYMHLFHTLTAKAEAWHRLYLGTNDAQQAKEELAAYAAAFRLVDYVERSYDSDEARLFLNKIKYLVHHKPIKTAYELYRRLNEVYYLEQAYIFDQKNKASVLSFNQQLAEQANQNNSGSRRREQELRSAITRLSLRAWKISDSSEIAAIEKEIREAEIELGRLQARATATAPRAFNQVPAVAHLQENLLDDRTGLVSYHLSDSSLLCFLITNSSFDAAEKKLPPQFTIRLTDWILSLRNGRPTDRQFSALLHQLLFSEMLPLKKEQWIIIPDDELNYLPFEAVADSSGSPALHRFTLQYQYATALLRSEKQSLSRQRSLGLAPFAAATGAPFQQLPYSAQEIAGYSSETLLNAAATRQALLQKIDQYPILHLATHAQTNPSQPGLSYIAFAPATQGGEMYLYAQEIYNLRLQKTRLVILSACETGAGNLEKGEGVMSLSRAFAYAGCPNIITSLWKADDASTAYIVQRFRSYLGKGQPISAALRQAKADYLDDPRVHPRKKHPYFWAHLVFVGKHEKVKSSPWWWLAAGAVLLLLLVVFWKMQGRKKAGTTSSSSAI